MNWVLKKRVQSRQRFGIDVIDIFVTPCVFITAFNARNSSFLQVDWDGMGAFRVYLNCVLWQLFHLRDNLNNRKCSSR